ncbi:MAG: DNA alkylation repair protein [Burkholderiales bacterium]|nr:DNA alkylation repair protein [Burkholderiales bacterium]
MEPFKNLINAELVRAAAAHLQRRQPDFDARAFVAEATRGLADLELKERAMHVAGALQHHLPADFDAAAALIEAALAPASQDEQLKDVRHDAGLAGWILWPVGEFVVRNGMQQPERALQLLHALTQRFSAEYAIRPFIASHPELAFATLARWARDPNLHVRRLVSEGSRPRLPWGMRLRALVADPSPTLPLLRALQDDPSPYVRRSVANHLNDIAKDHPQIVVAWLAEHLPGASAERRVLLRHASRTLVKKGHAPVLAAWGVGGRLRGEATLTIKPARVVLGGEGVQLALELRSTARSAQSLAIDYAVHHVKADGSTSPKVFKGWQIMLAPGETRRLVKRHAVRPITTRTYRPGRHLVVVQVNGRPVAEAAFTLRV